MVDNGVHSCPKSTASFSHPGMSSHPKTKTPDQRRNANTQMAASTCSYPPADGNLPSQSTGWNTSNVNSFNKRASRTSDSHNDNSRAVGDTKDLQRVSGNDNTQHIISHNVAGNSTILHYTFNLSGGSLSIRGQSVDAAGPQVLSQEDKQRVGPLQRRLSNIEPESSARKPAASVQRDGSGYQDQGYESDTSISYYKYDASSRLRRIEPPCIDTEEKRQRRHKRSASATSPQGLRSSKSGDQPATLAKRVVPTSKVPKNSAMDPGGRPMTSTPFVGPLPPSLDCNSPEKITTTDAGTSEIGTLAPQSPPNLEKSVSSRSGRTVIADDALIEWANSLLPASLQIADNPKGYLCCGPPLLHLAGILSGQPSTSPRFSQSRLESLAVVTDDADGNTDRPESGIAAGRILIYLFALLTSQKVAVGNVSVEDMRQGKKDKLLLLLRGMKAWEETRSIKV